MSLNRILTKLLNLELYISMKRFLTFKPPLIRSKTEKSTKNLDCLRATANLAAVETAEHDTEAVSHKTGDARSLECNTLKRLS